MVPSRACLINQKGAFSTFSNTFTAMVGHPYFAFQATGKPKATKRGRTQPGMPAPAGGGAQQQQGCRHAAGSPLCLPRSQLPQRAFVSLPPASHKQSAVLHTSPSPLARGGLGGGVVEIRATGCVAKSGKQWIDITALPASCRSMNTSVCRYCEL